MAITLNQHPLFAGVSRGAMQPLLSTARLTNVVKGDLLARPGGGRHEVLFVLDGFLHSYELTDDGGRVLFEVVGPGGFDGAIGALGGQAHFTEAATNGEVASIRQADIDRAIIADGHLAANFTAALAARVSRREHQLAASALKDPSRQIAKQLLAVAEALADGDGEAARLRLHVTHQQIADMLGIRRETATIHLHLLAKTGAVTLDPGGMRVSRRRLQGVLDGRIALPRS